MGPGFLLSLEDDAVGGINHTVMGVGYQDDSVLSAGGYWIIKDSGGPSWGDSGYGYIP